jgi:hypothetical protein
MGAGGPLAEREVSSQTLFSSFCLPPQAAMATLQQP